MYALLMLGIDYVIVLGVTAEEALAQKWERRCVEWYAEYESKMKENARKKPGMRKKDIEAEMCNRLNMHFDVEVSREFLSHACFEIQKVSQLQ